MLVYNYRSYNYIIFGITKNTISFYIYKAINKIELSAEEE